MVMGGACHLTQHVTRRFSGVGAFIESEYLEPGWWFMCGEMFQDQSHYLHGKFLDFQMVRSEANPSCHFMQSCDMSCICQFLLSLSLPVEPAVSVSTGSCIHWEYPPGLSAHG